MHHFIKNVQDCPLDFPINGLGLKLAALKKLFRFALENFQ